MPAADAASAPACHALVPCAGSGSRAGLGLPKQYATVGGRVVVAHALAALAAVSRVRGTLVVVAPGDREFARRVPEAAACRARAAEVGAADRAGSVAAGLEVLAREGVREQDWVLVHDAARCLLPPAAVERLIDACWDDPVGGLLALPLSDTLKSADAVGRAAATLPRTGRWLAQTPQMFRLGLLRQALAAARRDGVEVTDESSAVEALGLRPRLVEGEAINVKLTWPGDFALAERWLRAA